MTKRAEARLARQAEAAGAPPAGESQTSSLPALTAAPPQSGAVKTMSIPECGKLYFGLGRNGSYAAARRGDIPVIQIGRLKRAVPSVLDARLAGAGQTPPMPK